MNARQKQQRVLSIFGLCASLSLGLSGCATAQPPIIDTTSVGVTPTPTVTTGTPSPTVSTTPAPVRTLSNSQSHEDLAKNIVGVFGDWKSAGASHATHESRDIHLTLKNYAASVAATNTPVYAKKLFGADYVSKTASDFILKDLVDGMEKGNAENIVAFMQTDNEGVAVQNQNSNDLEPWKQTLILESVTSYTVLNGYHQLIINCVETDNREMNIYGGTPKGNQKETLTVTYVIEGETVRLTAAKFAER